jgi:hypothetical protein
MSSDRCSRVWVAASTPQTCGTGCSFNTCSPDTPHGADVMSHGCQVVFRTDHGVYHCHGSGAQARGCVPTGAPAFRVHSSHHTSQIICPMTHPRPEAGSAATGGSTWGPTKSTIHKCDIDHGTNSAALASACHRPSCLHPAWSHKTSHITGPVQRVTRHTTDW